MKHPTFKLIGGAFAALTLLIAAQTVSSIHHLSATQQRINTIVALHNKKIDIITRTQVAAHMRTDRLLRMSIEEDTFDRDNLYLEFLRAGFFVGSGRNELRQLGMTPEEKKSFGQQAALIVRIEEAQNKVTDLLRADRLGEGRKLLNAEAVPVQQEFNVLLAEMRNQIQLANDQALVEARKAYRNSLVATLTFGILATSLGAVLAWYTIRRLVASRRQTRQHLEELETSHAALQIEATHDPLTGLANRRLFYDRLEQSLSRAKRYGHKVGVLFIDLNRFKAVNDQHGHLVGDALLMEVSSRLKKQIRESDTVARSGGDEFLVVLDQINNAADCAHMVEQIDRALSGNVHLHGLNLTMSASIGSSIYPDDGETEDELVRMADLSMYDIKTSMPGAPQ